MEESGATRESIWSVPGEAQAWYFGLFGLLFGSGLALSLFRAASETSNLTDYAVKSWSYAAPLAITSAAAALLLVEAWGLLTILRLLIWEKSMVLAAYLREKFNLNRKDRDSKPTTNGGVHDHSMDRPPQPFADSPPGRVIEPEMPEEQHDR